MSQDSYCSEEIILKHVMSNCSYYYCCVLKKKSKEITDLSVSSLLWFTIFKKSVHVAKFKKGKFWSFTVKMTYIMCNILKYINIWNKISAEMAQLKS